MIIKKSLYISFLILAIATNCYCQKRIYTAVYLRTAYEIGGYKDEYLFKKAEKINLDLIRLDSMDRWPYYEIATLYHNKAEYLFNKLKIENQIDTSNYLKKREAAVEYWNNAIPYYLRYSYLLHK
jgi:hypothetical protein